jgi:hypothetical protein
MQGRRFLLAKFLILTLAIIPQHRPFDANVFAMQCKWWKYSNIHCWWCCPMPTAVGMDLKPSRQRRPIAAIKQGMQFGRSTSGDVTPSLYV